MFTVDTHRFTFRSEYALLSGRLRRLLPANSIASPMKIIARFRRKLAHVLHTKRLAPKRRREMTVSALIKEILSESESPEFSGATCLLSYDDVSLSGHSPRTPDFGGAEGSRLLTVFQKFVESHTDLRHSLFFVPFPRFCYRTLSMSSGSDICDAFNHHPLIRFLKNHESKNVLEVALHGFNHLSPYPKHFYPAFEFEFLSPDLADERIRRALAAMQTHFSVSGFKPPAWGLGQLSGSYYLPEVLTTIPQIRYACLSSPANGLNYSTQQVSHIYPTKFKGILNIPQNVSILWTETEMLDVIDAIVRRRGIINIQTHFSEVTEEVQDGISDAILERIHWLTSKLRATSIPFKLCREVARLCQKQ